MAITLLKNTSKKSYERSEHWVTHLLVRFIPEDQYWTRFFLESTIASRKKVPFVNCAYLSRLWITHCWNCSLRLKLICSIFNKKLTDSMSWQKMSWRKLFLSELRCDPATMRCNRSIVATYFLVGVKLGETCKMCLTTVLCSSTSIVRGRESFYILPTVGTTFKSDQLYFYVVSY